MKKFLIGILFFFPLTTFAAPFYSYQLSQTGLSSGNILQTNGTVSTWVSPSVVGGWATTSQDYYNSQFRDWKVLNSYLTPTTTIGFIISASSTISALTTTNGTTTNATSTNIYVSGDTTLGSATGLALRSSGLVGTYAGTSCTNQFPRSLNASGAATCASVANTDLSNSSVTINTTGGITGGGAVSLGSALTLNGFATSSVDYYQSQFRDWALTGSPLYLAPTTTRPILVNNGTSTITNLQTTNGTTTNATTTNLAISSALSGCLQTNANGLVTSTGSNCGSATGAWATTSADYYNSQFRDFSLQGSPLYLAPTTTRLVLLPGNASTTQLSSFSGSYFGATATTTITSTGAVGVGSSSPWAFLSVNPTAGVQPSFAVGSSTATMFAINQAGGIQLAASQPATTTAITLDWSNTPPQVEYRIGISATTITLTNATTSQYYGSRKLVYICNPGTAAGALTWAGVEWIGTAPSQTTTANQCDVYSFDITHGTSSTAWKVAGTAGTGFQ